jgi:DNA-directed RNA polymerase subunit L
MNELRELIESLISQIEDLRIEEERVADACSYLDEALDKYGSDLPETLRAQLQKLAESDPDRSPNEALEDAAREGLDAIDELEDGDDEEEAA